MARKGILWITALIIFVLVVAGSVAAYQSPQEQVKPRRAVVTFDGKIEDLPKLTPADFEIKIGKKKLIPSRIYAPGELPTLLAIVLQENQKAEFEAQLAVLREFILQQPDYIYVGVFYLTVDGIKNPAQFDSDHDRVAESLRAPKGEKEQRPRAYYNDVTQLVDYMDTLPDARKEILLFTEGSDPMARGASPKRNPYLSRTIEAAHQSGIPLWVIYSAVEGVKKRSSSGAVKGGLPRINPVGGTRGLGGPSHTANVNPYENVAGSGRSYVKRLTRETGGKLFSEKKFAQDIQPWLAEFTKLLDRQYVLEFDADESLQDEAIKEIKLKRKIRGVKLIFPRKK